MNKYNISLDGKVALITGGSRGIGRASALALAEAGADVVVTARKLPELEQVAEEIRAKGKKGLAVASHIAKPEESKALVEKVKTEFGRIDILLNNAGTNPYSGPVMDAPEWAWDATMNVNLKGPFIISQLVAKVMKEQGGGSIINIAALAGMKAVPGTIYGVSKAGIISLTWNLAKEFGQYNIRVNAISPGIVKTQMAESLWKAPEVGEAARQRVAMLRLGEPDDIASMVVFLSSDFSNWTTGANFVVDGGGFLGPPAHLQ